MARPLPRRYGEILEPQAAAVSGGLQFRSPPRPSSERCHIGGGERAIRDSNAADLPDRIRDGDLSREPHRIAAAARAGPVFLRGREQHHAIRIASGALR